MQHVRNALEPDSAPLEQVVVRIRPPLTKGVPRWSRDNCIFALSTCSLAIAPPEESQGCAAAQAIS